MEQEYLEIVKKIMFNRKFKKLREEKHHAITNRYDHLCSVAYLTYKMCKRHHLDYESATKAALMHDFFFNDEVTSMNEMIIHPEVSLQNALKLEKLNDKEKNIILSHMFPFGKHLPKYKESFVVDFADDIISVKEKFYGDYRRLANVLSFIFIVLINIKP